MKENFNLDMSRIVVINHNEQEWQASPMAGVKRIPLEREAAESGHVSSIVQYAAGSHFSEHFHPQGEEIFVLEGVFSDENGDYPAGSYLRNPPGSHHAPFSEGGCTLFVKLNQFKQGDQTQMAINTIEHLASRAGWINRLCHYMNLKDSSTALVRWPAGRAIAPHKHWGGEEISGT